MALFFRHQSLESQTDNTQVATGLATSVEYPWDAVTISGSGALWNYSNLAVDGIESMGFDSNTNSSAYAAWTPLGLTTETVYGRLFLARIGAAPNIIIFTQALTAAAAASFALVLNVNGTISIRNSGNSTMGTSTTAVDQLGNFVRIEFAFNCAGPSMINELRVYSNPLSDTGETVSLINTTITVPDQIRFGLTPVSSTNLNTHYMDAMSLDMAGWIGTSMPSSGPTEPLVPDADVSAGGWLTGAGGATNLYQQVDDPAPNDADYVKFTM